MKHVLLAALIFVILFAFWGPEEQTAADQYNHEPNMNVMGVVDARKTLKKGPDYRELSVLSPVATTEKIQKVLVDDMEVLSRTAKQFRSAKKECNGNYLRLYGEGVGQFSNHIITLIHGIAVADSIQVDQIDGTNTGKAGAYTLLVPKYIASDLAPFDLTLLQSLYCIEFLEKMEDDELTNAFLVRVYVD